MTTDWWLRKDEEDGVYVLSTFDWQRVKVFDHYPDAEEIATAFAMFGKRIPYERPKPRRW